MKYRIIGRPNHLLCAFLALFSGGLFVSLEASAQLTSEVEDRAVESNDPTVVDRIVAVIDGEPITVFDIQNGYKQRGESLPANAQPGSAEFAQAVREYVGYLILEREAKSLGLVVNDAELTAYIDEIKRQNGVDDRGFYEMLQTRNLALDDYKKQITTDILRSRLVGNRIRSKVNISDRDIERYVDENPDIAPPRDAVHLEQILIPYGEDPDAARKRAENIYERIDDGDDFDEAGEGYYVDLGFIALGDLRTDLQKQVEKLDRNEYSRPFDTDRGVYILKVRERHEGIELPADVKEAVRNQLFQEKFKDEIDEYLNRELPKKHNVELKILRRSA